MQQELHITEEDSHLLWGLIILVCTTAGTYLLTGSFSASGWNPINLWQVAALLLFLISFMGIFKLSEPRYQFIFRIEDNLLQIEILKGSHPVDVRMIPLRDIAALKFSPVRSRSSGEALFDFSRSYHLMWRKRSEASFKMLLAVESSHITLKVDDIASIMRFIKRRIPDVEIPPSQANFFNL
ncbi:MAG TPA: hypothetical protein VK112_03960 [Fodinibius sp.]|nr:hypothetical protein [Fodinibius sp.]